MKSLFVFLLILIGLTGLTSALGLGPIVLNQEGEQRIAYLLAAPTVVTEPGISFAIATTPISVIERRWQHLSSEPREIQTRDRELLLLNPLLHMLEWLRSAFFVEFESRYMSVEYALWVTLVTVFLGLLMLRGLNKRILAAV